MDVDAIWMQLAAVQGADTALLLYLVLCSALVYSISSIGYYRMIFCFLVRGFFELVLCRIDYWIGMLGGGVKRKEGVAEYRK